MFGFLAVLGPVGAVVAGVATLGVAAYNFMDDDEYDTIDTTESNHHDEKNELIKKEIESYKQKQINIFKTTYGIDIEFVPKQKELSNILFMGHTISNAFDNTSTIAYKCDIALFKEIDKLQKEIDELGKLSKLLDSYKLKEAIDG